MLKKLGNLLNNSKNVNKTIRNYNAGKMIDQLEIERTMMLGTVIY